GMKVVVHAVGRMKSGPERELAARYLDRLSKAGPAVGLEFGGLAESAEGRGRTVAERQREEAAALEAVLPQGGVMVLLDEHGKSLASPDFAARLAGWRDGGQRAVVFAIGGPDGHGELLRSSAEL